MDRSRKISFRHLFRLSDHTGLLEHAHRLLPRRKEGYTADDNARALWTALAWIREIPEGELRNALFERAEIYLAFLEWVSLPNGRFHNNITYDGRQEEESPSDDLHGRVLWALAWAERSFPQKPHRKLATELLEHALGPVRRGEIRALRGMAYTLATLAFRGIRRPEERRAFDEMTATFRAAFATNSQENWTWFEPHLTYSNALLPWGLLAAYEVSADRELRDIALASLDFLIHTMTDSRREIIRPIGNRGWGVPGKIARFDQQPVDVWKLAMATEKAYALTRNPFYRETFARSVAWFTGANDLGIPLVDEEEGAAYDGLTPSGPNENAGAEATLSYLMTAYFDLRMAALTRQRIALTSQGENVIFGKVEQQVGRRAL